MGYLGEMKYENKITLTDLLDENRVPYIGFVSCFKQDGSKDSEAIGRQFKKGWTLWTWEECQKYNKTIKGYDCINVNLKKSSFVVMDNDEKRNDYEFKNMVFNQWITQSISKGLCHAWFKKEDNDDSTDLVDAYPDDKGHLSKCDLRYNNVFELADAVLYYNDEMKPFEFKLNHPKPKDKNEVKEIKQSIQIIGLPKNMDIIELIDVKYIDDYDTWKRIVWAMKNENYTEEEAQSISKKSQKYDEEGFSNVWDKSPSTISVTQGTLNYYAKLSNEKMYYEIINKHKIDWDMITTERGIAELFLMSYKDDYVYKDEILYIYSKKNWRIEKPSYAKNELSKGIKNICCGLMQSLVIDLKNTEDKQETQNINSKINKMSEISVYCYKTTWINNIYNMLINILSGNDYPMEFDTLLPDVLCFTNKAFDINTGKEVVITKYDYITMNTGYDYTPSTEEQFDLLDELIKLILPTKELRDCYLSILHTCMSGNRPENFILANGGGRNGKGLLNELMSFMLGKQYFYKGATTTLTEKFKSGSCEELSQMDKKRMVIFTEPNDSDYIQLGNVKTLTGDTTVHARGIYSKKTDTRILATIILECNKKPKINGRIDESAISRFINVLFPSTFTDDEEKLKLDNHHRINKKYKTMAFQQEYKCVLFDYLIKHSKKELYIPKCIKNETQSYLMENDDLSIWVEDNYDYDTTAQPITIKELFMDYKNSEYYYNMSKKDKQKTTEKVFKEMIQSNIKMRSFYCDRKKINGNSLFSIVINHKKKSIENKCHIQE